MPMVSKACDACRLRRTKVSLMAYVLLSPAIGGGDTLQDTDFEVRWWATMPTLLYE